MPYQGIADGLYLASTPGAKVKGIPVVHYGIIDIGNVLKAQSVDESGVPTVIHQTPPRIKFEHLLPGTKWKLIDRIADVDGAVARIRKAAKNPEYDLLGNNCEHFAKFVAHDTKVSGQVLVGVAVAGGIALGAVILSQLLKE